MKKIKAKTKQMLYFLFSFYYLIFFLIYKKINPKRLRKLKYNSLFCLSYLNEGLFKKYKFLIESSILNDLKDKDIIKIGFITYTPTMWSVDKLFEKLTKNKKYKSEIIVSKFETLSEDSMNKNFKETLEYFTLKSYACITPDSDDFDIDSYDILIYMTPYNLYQKNLNVKFIKCDKLICYVSYSFMLAEKKEKLNLPIYILSWRYFCDSLFYKNLIQTESRVYSNNVRYYGYPKMDGFYHQDQNIKKGRKVIIYAPHHSLMHDRIQYSTFDQNYYFMLELAKKYSKETYWIYKPHPLLRSHSVKAGLFKKEEDYDFYVEKWRNLVNAKVINNEPYIDTFKISDAMITDSVSFLAEYQYVNKPLLLLENDDTYYNQFGESIKKIISKCQGIEFEEIEKFVKSVIYEEDFYKEKRNLFFSTNLDYYAKNKILANDGIYNEIISEINGSN